MLTLSYKSELGAGYYCAVLKLTDSLYVSVHLTVFFFFIQLLDYEAKAAEQVPLLMKMNHDDIALDKAIESGDTDLSEYKPIKHFVFSTMLSYLVHTVH